MTAHNYGWIPVEEATRPPFGEEKEIATCDHQTGKKRRYFGHLESLDINGLHWMQTNGGKISDPTHWRDLTPLPEHKTTVKRGRG
jgi:hypothetical protein